MVFSLAAFFVLFMYRHLTTLQLQRLYENFHKEAPADLLAHLGSLDACSNQGKHSWHLSRGIWLSQKQSWRPDGRIYFMEVDAVHYRHKRRSWRLPLMKMAFS